MIKYKAIRAVHMIPIMNVSFISARTNDMQILRSKAEKVLLKDMFDACVSTFFKKSCILF